MRYPAAVSVLTCVLLFTSFSTSAQERTAVSLSAGNGLLVQGEIERGGVTRTLTRRYPLFSFEVNDEPFSSALTRCFRDGDVYRLRFTAGIDVSVREEKSESRGWCVRIIFTNTADAPRSISNVVPLGTDKDHLFITASGPWSLARTKIFAPDRGPVGVVLPDNAWELGYGSVPLREGAGGFCALARRTGAANAEKQRWKTVLKPGGSVTYTLYADLFDGPWQNGLRLMFQDRWLYDLDTFDQTLFNRPDLSWMRHQYTLTLQFAWDREFYDAERGGYQVDSYLDMGARLFGGWDVLGLWPTWPTLGVDQRNQWDLYGDMPGGYALLSSLAERMKERGTRFFVAYNPWDLSTRQVDPYQGLAELIRATGADGVVLDCSGSSSFELQAAADGVKPGVIMYSEGMAVPGDMPGIVAGRVHDAIFMPPPLNLNKFIKPDFAVFRVCQLSQGRLHREMAVSFFNGYGIEMNVFAPGRPGWIEEEYTYWGSLVRVLRENSDAFLSPDWTPLLPVSADSIWVNRWQDGDKTLYTVLSLRPDGYSGPLFEVKPRQDIHYVSLIHHRELRPDTLDAVIRLPAETRAFDRAFLATRREGNVDCIAALPVLLQCGVEGDELTVSAGRGDLIRIWAGHPSYQNRPAEFVADGVFNLTLLFPEWEGDYVVQLLEGGRLLDERIVSIPPGTPRLVSRAAKTVPAEDPGPGMRRIPGGTFIYAVNVPDSFIPYPDLSAAREITVSSFAMDEYPVTNREYAAFLAETGYEPTDTANFLAHWENGICPDDRGDFPVVYVSLEDARAYASWAGKRLPTEIEWQYAACGGDTANVWPWGAAFDSTRCNVALDHMTPVNAFGNGGSDFGVKDLVGNVWQLTGDVYDNGSHRFIIMRGGSYYHPASSWWYVKGGPRPVNQTQMLLRVSPGFERNATVGFRCVRDVGK
ncbi:SUMF1/EgtB/PvdO family nonheme iron enzyme [bacterium]|nr:SUMF1/EgtB/PvdO family nonheme iron enzyme [bacterium]